MWRRLIYHPEINYGLRQTIILCLPVAISWLFNDLRSGLLFSLVPACCNIAGLDTPHRHFFKRLIIGGLLFSASAFLTLKGLQLDIPLPLILLTLALLFGVVNEISPLHARLLPASLVASIFTLSLPNSVPAWYPIALCLSGVLWYGAFTYFWLKLWKEQPVRELLCSLYKEIAGYFDAKYSLLINQKDETELLPELLKKQQAVMDIETQIYQQLQMMKGMHNSQYKRLLRSFQVALDLQEHISVSWNQPEESKRLISQSQIDLLVRHCAKIISKRLRTIADDIQYHRKSAPFSMRNEILAIKKIAHQHPNNEVGKFYVYHFSRVGRLLRSLVPLYNRSLMPERPRVPFWRCIINYLSLKSPSLRNAARIGVTLAFGSLLGLVFNLPKPFWILLTIMFVSQNGYNATRIRIQHRAVGTLCGLILAVGILNLPFSQNLMLLIMLALTLASYFIVRKNYAIAVTGFTITAVYTLQLITLDASNYLVARMIDTIIGGILALASSIWLWPQWQSGLLRKNAHEVLEYDQSHLRMLLGNDRNDNELAYSCMQLNQAHNTLVTSLNQSMQEPGFDSRYLDDMRLWVSHSQFIVEHLNAVTILAHDNYLISTELAQQYLTECEIAIQSCQQRLDYDQPEQPTNTMQNTLPESSSSDIVAHHLSQIIHHLNIMRTISSLAWSQRPHHGAWLPGKLSNTKS
jgi:YccS/YhfK family integral membrane protein